MLLFIARINLGKLLHNICNPGSTQICHELDCGISGKMANIYYNGSSPVSLFTRWELPIQDMPQVQTLSTSVLAEIDSKQSHLKIIKTLPSRSKVIAAVNYYNLLLIKR